MITPYKSFNILNVFSVKDFMHKINASFCVSISYIFYSVCTDRIHMKGSDPIQVIRSSSYENILFTGIIIIDKLYS